MAIITPLDWQHLDHHRARIGALTAGTRGRWGTMDAVHMVCHLHTSVALSVDDHEVVDRSIPVIRTIGRWLVFDTFTTWPRGRFRASPQFVPDPEGSFEEERRRLLAAYDRFVAEARDHPHRKTVSPVLGPITMQYWTHAHGVHLNHHYRQFGLA